MPDATVEIALSDPPLTASPTFTDVTSDVRQWSVTRSRDETTGHFEASTATIVLDNIGRDYEPFGGIGLKRRQGIHIYVPGTPDVPVWRGFIDRIDLSYSEGGKDAIAILSCVDLLGLLAQMQLENPYVRAVVSADPWAYWRLNESSVVSQALPGSAGTLANDSSGNGRSGLYYGTIAAVGVSDDVTDEKDGAITLDGTGYVGAVHGDAPINGTEPWSIGFAWRRAANSEFEDLVATFANEGGPYTGGIVSGMGFVRIDRAGTGGTIVSTASSYDDDAWHFIVATFDGTNCRIYVDGALDGGPTAAGAGAFGVSGVVLIGAGDFGLSTGSFSEVAAYTTELGSSQVITQYDARNALLNETSGERIVSLRNYAGIPDGLLSFDPGSPPGESSLTSAGNLASQKALEAMHDASVTEAGPLFVSRDGKLTFHGRDRAWTQAVQATYVMAGDPGDAEPTGIILSDPTLDIANVVTVARRNGETHVARDLDSIDSHGETTLAIKSVGNSSSEAIARGFYDLNRRSDPDSLRIESLEFFVDGTELLDRELWDRVAVEFQPPGGGDPIEQEGLITGIEHSWTQGDWRMSMSLSSIEARGYFIWGTSTWGNDTRWTF